MLRTCEIEDCTNEFERIRGRWAALCPEHRNSDGWRRMMGQRGLLPPGPERALIAVIREEFDPDQAAEDDTAKRRDRVTGLLGIERAVERVHKAETELADARRALRLAATRARIAPGASARHD